MTKARAQQISLETTSYYHCVRRVFLCGDSYENRRAWIEDKLLVLPEVICIDVAAYAVDDHRQVQPAFAGVQVGNIPCPFLIRFIRAKVTRQQVG